MLTNDSCVVKTMRRVHKITTESVGLLIGLAYLITLFSCSVALKGK